MISCLVVPFYFSCVMLGRETKRCGVALLSDLCYVGMQVEESKRKEKSFLCCCFFLYHNHYHLAVVCYISNIYFRNSVCVCVCVFPVYTRLRPFTDLREIWCVSPPFSCGENRRTAVSKLLP